MKTSRFRRAMGLGGVVGAALATTVILGLGSADVSAAGNRHFGVSLWARTDVAPDIVVRVLDASAHDIAATCQRGGAVSPDIDGWQCQSADDLVLDISAGPGVDIDLRCSDAHGTQHVSSTGQYTFPASLGNVSCLARATPPAAAAPITPVSLNLTTPLGQEGAALSLFDEQGHDRVAECITNGSSTNCSPLPYGTYHFGVRGGSSAMRLQVSCFVYSTAAGGGQLIGIDSLVLGPWTLTASCHAVAASPALSVYGTGQLVRVVDDAGTVTDCTPLDVGSWECDIPATGGYHLELSEQAALLPSACTAMYGDSAIDPQAFTISGDGLEWYSCTVTGPAVEPTTPTSPTTIGGPVDSGAPSDTIGSEAPVPTTVAPRGLPSTGGAAPLLPAALLVLALGAGASLLARRPVR